MWWIVFLIIQGIVIWSGIRQEQRAGMWSWSKFVFALAFGLLECAIILVPLTYIDFHSRYFKPIMVAAAVVAALNFIWMIIVARRWKLPDGRTSLQAYYDSRNRK
jgi:hypothetical protein